MAVDKQEIFLRRLGATIRRLRIENGLRQEDFDDETEIGITCRGFQEIEYGKKNVKIYTLAKIAERMGITLSKLLGYVEGMEEPVLQQEHHTPKIVNKHSKK